jgi:hypothetical protein
MGFKNKKVKIVNLESKNWMTKYTKFLFAVEHPVEVVDL